MARANARPPDGAARRAANLKAHVEPDRPRKLTRSEHQLPDGRYLLAYGHDGPAPSDA